MERSIEVVGEGERCRKHKRNSSKWKRNIAKKQRHSGKSLPEYPSCNHNTKAISCLQLTMQDIKHFHDCFYQSTDKIKQDLFLLKHLEAKEIKRRRPTSSTRKPSQLQTKYFVRKISKKLIPVCQNAFVRILGVSKARVLRIAKEYSQTGQQPRENRGGDTTSHKNIEKMLSVTTFINNFKGIESHYCRARSGRIYLASELSIKKMWIMYQNSVDNYSLKVNESYFREIFVTKYNISFKSPASDKCSMCLSLDNKIKITLDSDKKDQLKTEKKLHKLRAKAFYEMMKDNSNDKVLILSFDCQENQHLPKVPDQLAYFSRQLNIHNFTIVEGSSKSPIDNNVNIYYWTEDKFGKGSNEITSALHHKLCSLYENRNISTIRLFADGCGGQNKNTSMIGMCSAWLGSAPNNFNKIEIIFPIVGHSFLPPDRVFGLIERTIKKMEVIIEPREYVEIFEKFGKAYELGKDVDVKNWKNSSTSAIKGCPSWHFKLKSTKRIILHRDRGKILVQSEYHYTSDLNTKKSIFKKMKSYKDIVPNFICPGKSISQPKLKDVERLLKKHYGDDWKTRSNVQFYVNLINNNPPDTLIEEDPQEISEFEEEELSFT